VNTPSPSPPGGTVAQPGQAAGSQPGASTSVLSRDVHDIDDLAAAQWDWKLRYEQLSPGAFRGRFRVVQLPDLRLICEAANRATRQRGRLGAGQVAFAMTLSPDGSGYFHGQAVDGETITIGRGDEIDLTMRENAHFIAVVVSAGLLSELWQQLYGKPWSSWLDRKLAVQARPGAADRVRATHLRTLEAALRQPELLAVPASAAQLRDAVLLEWLEAIPGQVEVRDLHRIEARQRIVDLAIEGVLRSPHSPLTMLEICKQVGASPRRLELCFRDVLGISPHKYLRAVRLCGARRELKQLAGGAVVVHDVAARWGFWHMSAFTADYKLQFGELPSATLHGARGRSGDAAG
jgi:AraC family transcriptional regulator, ethanolamine operon transcriptional activator